MVQKQSEQTGLLSEGDILQPKRSVRGVEHTLTRLELFRVCILQAQLELDQSLKPSTANREAKNRIRRKLNIIVKKWVDDYYPFFMGKPITYLAGQILSLFPKPLNDEELRELDEEIDEIIKQLPIGLELQSQTVIALSALIQPIIDKARKEEKK